MLMLDIAIQIFEILKQPGPKYLTQATISGFLSRGLSLEEGQSLLKKSVKLAVEARDKFWDAKGSVPGNSYNRALVVASIGSYGSSHFEGTSTASCLRYFSYERFYVIEFFPSEDGDAPRAYHGLEEHNGDHGEDEQGLQGSKDKLEEHGGCAQLVPISKEMTKMPFDPLKMPLGPMTRARAKKFKDALTSFVQTHLEELKTIEVQLKSFDEDKGKNVPIDSKLVTLLAIDG
ncbi:Homocysteine S-methyltransferase [Corchorus capsularis]|uniref:Homocysteine S-methyltransferase n=1 Tax=Corchorus capsularis TaxID=210143 RepID=A0A1R3GW14_COCAP|nr:Homocysteine S-methyltransferase [Corchorus capsularis]